MAAQRFHRPPGRHRPNKVGTAPPVQVDQLDARGPLHPDTESARWPIHDPFDAVDALDLSRPEGFESGVLVLFLDENREPTVVLAVHNAPAAELDIVILEPRRSTARRGSLRVLDEHPQRDASR